MTTLNTDHREWVGVDNDFGSRVGADDFALYLVSNAMGFQEAEVIIKFNMHLYKNSRT